MERERFGYDFTRERYQGVFRQRKPEAGKGNLRADGD